MSSFDIEVVHRYDSREHQAPRVEIAFDKEETGIAAPVMVEELERAEPSIF